MFIKCMFLGNEHHIPVKVFLIEMQMRIQDPLNTFDGFFFSKIAIFHVNNFHEITPLSLF